MGNFYTNYTLKNVDPSAVAAALSGRKAAVTPAVNGTVVVYDSASDEQDGEIIKALAEDLSKKLDCPLLAVLNHDDDILWYQLYSSGQLQDEYDSSSGYFDDSGDGTPSGGDAEKLCSAFGSTNVAPVRQILTSSLDDGTYIFAVQRHEALVQALGISQYAVGVGFNYLQEGDLPEGLDPDSVIYTR